MGKVSPSVNYANSDGHGVKEDLAHLVIKVCTSPDQAAIFLPRKKISSGGVPTCSSVLTEIR